MYQILFVVVIVVNFHWRIFFTLTFKEIGREKCRKKRRNIGTKILNEKLVNPFLQHIIHLDQLGFIPQIKGWFDRKKQKTKTKTYILR